MASDVRGRAEATVRPYSPARRRFALLALALGGFAIGSTEFVALGLLPNIARDLLPDVWAVSHGDAVAQAGILASAYAAGVVVGAPTIAAVAARLPRKGLLLGLLVALTVATVAASVLPTFGLVVLARFVAGLPHGAYFGVATLAASELLGPGNRGRAAAFVLGGLTIANIVGVPTITYVGEQAGWRIAYVIVAAAFALTFLAIWAALPKTPADRTATVRNELKAFAKPQVWLTVAFAAIGFGGFFCAYTYIAPVTTSIARLPEAFVPIVLVVFGVGMTIGNFAGGFFADRGIKRAVIVCFVGVIAALAVLDLTASNVVGLLIGVLLVGIASTALSPAMQVRLMDVARESKTIGAATTHSALNIGNSLGAAIGGLVIAAGFGYLAPIQIGILLTVAGLAIAIVAFAVDRPAGRADIHLDRADLAGPAA